MNKTLLNLYTGRYAVIKRLLDDETTSKLVSLGILPDQRVQMIRKAPFGGAMIVKINHQFFAIRETEAAKVEIEIL